MSRVGVKCDGFTFSKVPIDTIKSWNIPGVKIDQDGTIRSLRCAQRATRRWPICKECHQSQEILGRLVDNFFTTVSSDDEDELDEPIDDELQTPTRATRPKPTSRPLMRRSISSKKAKKVQEKNSTAEGPIDPLESLGIRRKKRDATPKKPQESVNSTIDISSDQLETPLDQSRDADESTQESPGKSPTRITRSKRKLPTPRDSSISSTDDNNEDEDEEEPKKRRSGRLRNKTSSSIGKSSPFTAGPIADLCRRLISESLKQNADRRDFACQLCPKKAKIRFVVSGGRTVASKLAIHAMAEHLIEPAQQYYQCRICQERKNVRDRMKMHILRQHRDDASLEDWDEQMIDETGEETNQLVIMDVIEKCFGGQQEDQQQTEETNNNGGDGGKEPTENTEPAVVGEGGDKDDQNREDSASRKDASPNAAERRGKTKKIEDPVQEYCLRLIRDKQDNGSLKCQLCKNNFGVNVSSYFDTEERIYQRVKTHAFMHQGRRYYKCKICDYGTVTHVLMSRHVNAQHERTRRGDDPKFDDLSVLPENRADVLRALERCYEGEPQLGSAEAADAVAVLQQEGAAADAPAAFVYLMPNGDLVLPGEIEQREDAGGEAHVPLNINRIPPGCIVTFHTADGIEEMTVMLQQE